MKKIILSSVFIFTFAGAVQADPPKMNQKNHHEVKKNNHKADITVKEAKQALNKKSHIFIDVREEWEYTDAHIRGVKLIPLATLEAEALKLDKKAKYITVCASGVRSKKAADKMNKMGLNTVNMTGGMIQWQEKGYPVQSGK